VACRWECGKLYHDAVKNGFEAKSFLQALGPSDKPIEEGVIEGRRHKWG